jgi:hypothetical protein
MLANAMNRICPSLSFAAVSNTARHRAGLTKGRTPSITSIKASAPSSSSQKPGATVHFFEDDLDGAATASPRPRIAWKKSLLGSTTITSVLLRKLPR